LELTNYKPLWEDIGSPPNIAVFLVYHGGWDKRLTIDTIKALDVDKIFIVDQEGHCANWVYEDERIYVWDSTYIDHPRFFPYFWWWDLVSDVASSEHLLEKITNKQTYHFEAMLGNQKPTSDIIYKYLKTDSRVLMNYFHKSKTWIPVGLEYVDTAFSNTSGVQVNFNNQQYANISTFIPVNIYSQTWFSIITESRPTDIFFSEKTAKPLLCGRLFVFFGAKHSLRTLHQIGFKTFSQVIDESYDNIEDDTQRWNAALEQIDRLLDQDPRVIKQQVLGVLEHNQRLMQNTKWSNLMTIQMQRVSES
jgi:hypothetical protein